MNHLSPLIALLCLPGVAMTMSPAHAERHEVSSPDWNFVLDVNPNIKTQRIYRDKDRSAPLWSFEYEIPSFFYPKFFLSSNGEAVAAVADAFTTDSDVKSEPCIWFWTKDGLTRTHKFSDVCPGPPRTDDYRDEDGGHVGPKGPFWRIWHTRVVRGGDKVAIDTTIGKKLILSLKDGSLVEEADSSKADHRSDNSGTATTENEPVHASNQMMLWYAGAAALVIASLAVLIVLIRRAVRTRNA